MRIIEVRDGFIKVEAEKAVKLSSFLRVSYFEKNYVAQVMQVKNAGSVYNIYAKLVYLFNGVIIPYDKSLPSRESIVEPFSFEEVNDSFEIKMPIVPFEFVDGTSLKVDKDFLDSLLMSIDTPEYTKNILSNISKQTVNTIVIDMQGNLGMDYVVAAKDFKLPLNTASLEFMYEDCLNDATKESKGLVKEIFSDLSEYSKTVDFLPFSALKTIVDDMVDKAHVFKLLVLKNKLAKFEKLGYFAADKNEVSKLGDILKTGNITIKLSNLDSVFQNRYLEVILSMISELNINTKVFINASNVLNKKNLKTIVMGSKLNPVLITNSKFKYLNNIKTMYKNFVVEPSFANNELFGAYRSMLSVLPKENLLFIGEFTSRLPLVVNSAELSNISPIENVETAEIIENVESTENAEITDAEVSIQDEVEPVSEEDAIDQKSEELINQISDEVNATDISEEAGLFEDETAEDQLSENEQPEPDMQLEEIAVEENDSLIGFSERTEFHTEVDSTKSIEVPEEIITADEAEEEIPLEQETVEVDLSEDVTALEDENNLGEETEVVSDAPVDTLAQDNEYEVQTDDIQEPEIITDTEDEVDKPISVEAVSDDDSEFDEIVELSENDISDDDILVDLTEEDEDSEISEELDKAIVEDVDKVYTTIKEDSISDEDLDFIDELNNDLNDSVEVEEVNQEDEIVPIDDLQSDDEGFLEPLEEVNDSDKNTSDAHEILETRNTTTPIVPVYDAEIPAEDIVVSDPIEQGDTVVHAKYGAGVVEKMIKYGTKNLYSINFDNVGRRLLDPTLTEIKKA